MRYRLLVTSSVVAALASLYSASPALAQSSEPAASDEVGDHASDIVVTGVRGKPRSILDSPTPIDVISGDAIEDGGKANLYQSLQAQVPSFNQPMKAGGGTSSAVVTGALRGLNPDHTLVLVNGQRWHNTALINLGQQLYNGSVPVDLGMIPASAIERIEVMREGAAAQYGSDAIAGVINIILKSKPGGSVSAQYGQNFDKGDGDLALARGDYGFDISDSGSLNLFFSVAKQSQSNRAFAVASSLQLYPRLPDGSLDPREATVDRVITKGFGVYSYRQFQFGYNLKEQLGDIELYSFGIFNRRIQDILYPPIIPNQKEALPELYPNFTYPLFQLRENDGQIALGLRGQLGGWDWHLSSTAGEDYAPQHISRNLNPSLGPTSPTEFHLGTLIGQQWVNSLDLTRGLGLAKSGNLQVSFGLQHRLERFKIKPGDPESYILGSYVRPAGQAFAGVPMAPGAVYAPGFRPQDAGSWKRNILGAYVELGYEPNDKLFIGVAGRADHYDDSSGTSLVGKIDGRYKLTDWLTLRGSFGNGFHAPSLPQQHYSNARATPLVLTSAGTVIITNQTLPVDNPAAIALGSTPLKPEKSVDASLGFTLNPAANFNLTVDGYVVKLRDRIVLSSLLRGAAVDTILVANGLAPNLTGQYFTNALDTRTIGLDVIATYTKDLDALGKLRLTAAANYNHTKITHIDPNPPELNALGSSYQLVNRTTQGFLTRAIPETKIMFGQNWAVGGFEFNLQETRYGKFANPGVTAALDRFFPAKWIVDAQVKYKITDRLSVAIGADNLFNVYPPPNNIPSTTNGQDQYPRFAPYGFTGGSYYGRISADF